MTIDATPFGAQRVHVGRWLVAALVCGALAAFARPDGTRARHAARAETLGEYLALRARPPAAESDPLRPLLATKLAVGRGASLFFASVVDDSVRLDDCAGPLPRMLDAALTGPSGASGLPLAAPSASGPAVVLLACDEAGLVPGFDTALAQALALPVLSGAARGQSPLGHIGLFERARWLRVAAFVSVWNLANDLGETELLRRLHGRLEASGPVDEFLDMLRDPARAAAAQESWFAERDDAAREVVAVLGGVGFELERRARLHGAREVIVLLGQGAEGPERAATPRTTTPCTERMVEAVERALAERGVRVVVLTGEGGLRDSQGRLTEHAVAQLVADVRAALE